MKVEKVNLKQVATNDENPRSITDTKFAKLVNNVLSFPKMLELRPIVISDEMKALGGNMRLRALQHISKMKPAELDDLLATIPDYTKATDGEREAVLNHWRAWLKKPTAPVVYASTLTEQEQRRFIILDNVGFGDWDWDELANNWDGEELGDWGLDNWGAGDGWANGDMAGTGTEEEQKEATEDEFNEDEEKIPSRCKECELWQLGKHRLLCGDSTDAEQVKFLMGGTSVNLYLTDPPYNVGYGYESPANARIMGHRTDGLVVLNDKMGNEQFRDFLSSAFRAAEEAMEKGAAFYIFHSDSYSLYFREALMSTNDLGLRQVLIWNKDAFCFGRQDYQWKHEPCLYGWKNGSAHHWFNDRSQTTVIDMNRPKVSKEHPTMKPVQLFAYLMGNSTKEGWSVYDGFAGSGTTLIAAEQLNRKAFLMELDPHYCDVIISRWEKLTGEKAVKIGEFNNGGE